MSRFVPVLLMVAFTSISRLAAATPIFVSIDTSSIAGTSAQLAFDVADGGAPANSVVISDFTTDGTLGPSSATGGVSGSLPGSVTLNDAAFFSELLTGLILGTTISFN